ncbi:MAG: hypothetical protein K2O09_09090, partial [Treponemataceae bacterium]|nr:hypothetical protein [Treponemataceae bacterium]
MRRSIAQYVAAPWCALAILLAACTGDGAATEDDRHVENPAPKPEMPAEPDSPDTPDDTGNYTPKYESARAVLKEILGDKYDEILEGMPQNITLTARTIDAVIGISSVLESVTKASDEEHETENMTDAKTKVNTLTEKADGSEEALQDTSAEGLEKMLQAFNAEEAKQALQALVAQTEKKISLSKTEKKYSGYNGVYLWDDIESQVYDITANGDMNLSLDGNFKYFDNHIESLNGNIDISNITITSQVYNGVELLIPEEDLKEEIYNKLNLEGKNLESLPTLAFKLGGDKELGLKHFLEIYDTYAYGKSEKFNLTASFGSMDGRTLVEGVAKDEYTLFEADGDTAKASGDGTIKSFDINELVDFADTYHISRFSNLIISGDAKQAEVNWQLTNIIFEGNMSKLTNTYALSDALRGIVYFMKLPYDNKNVNFGEGQYMNGVVKLDELGVSTNIRLQPSIYSVIDIRKVDEDGIIAYNPSKADHIFSQVGSVYFNENVQPLVNGGILYSKFIQATISARIDNEYFGDKDRRNSVNSLENPASKKPRKLSEFEYYGIHSKFEHAAVESYNGDFSGVTKNQEEKLKADINVKLIAKVSTLCPLC